MTEKSNNIHKNKIFAQCTFLQRLVAWLVGMLDVGLGMKMAFFHSYLISIAQFVKSL